jgi:hypothetical protein
MAETTADTLRPPPPDDAPAVMTCGQFKSLLAEMVGDKLMQILASLARVEQTTERHALHLASHELRIADLERKNRSLEQECQTLRELVAALEARAAT